jgi:nitroreductase
MVRSFAPDPIEPAVLEALLAAALRAPSAGNTGGTAWLVLEGKAQTDVYWESTTDEAWRATSGRWPGLRRVPVILLAYASAEAYVARYAEPDKAGRRSGTGERPDAGTRQDAGPTPDGKIGPAGATGPDLGLEAAAWPVPYWIGDAAFGVMTILLGAVDAGLGACVLGNFRGEGTLARALGVPSTWRLFCAVPLGHADGLDHRSRSLDRERLNRDARVHHGSWTGNDA